jgi:hypothetical protein
MSAWSRLEVLRTFPHVRLNCFGALKTITLAVSLKASRRDLPKMVSKAKWGTETARLERNREQ